MDYGLDTETSTLRIPIGLDLSEPGMNWCCYRLVEAESGLNVFY